MAEQWRPKGTIKSKLLPIEIATNDYWEASDDDQNPMVVDGKKRYFTWAEAMAIKADGWRLPTRAEWAVLCTEFGEKDGDIGYDALIKALGLGKNGYVNSGSLWFAGDIGYYWSSIAYPSTSGAYYLYFRSGNFYSGCVNPSSSAPCHFGQSVRLVRDVKE